MFARNVFMYRRLRLESWTVNDKGNQQIWREEGPTAPATPARGSRPPGGQAKAAARHPYRLRDRHLVPPNQGWEDPQVPQRG